MVKSGFRKNIEHGKHMKLAKFSFIRTLWTILGCTLIVPLFLFTLLLASVISKDISFSTFLILGAGLTYVFYDIVKVFITLPPSKIIEEK